MSRAYSKLTWNPCLLFSQARLLHTVPQPTIIVHSFSCPISESSALEPSKSAVFATSRSYIGTKTTRGYVAPLISREVVTLPSTNRRPPWKSCVCPGHNGRFTNNRLFPYTDWGMSVLYRCQLAFIINTRVRRLVHASYSLRWIFVHCISIVKKRV